MGEYHIKGGIRLEGEIRVQGAKNAILPILASTVLNKGESIIHNCPDISDTHTSIAILRTIGCDVTFERNTLVVNSANADNYSMPEALIREMRSSIIFLGGILGRFKRAEIYHPGGCELGQRPIDYHIRALKEMGVEINEEGGYLDCRVERIKPARIHLDFPSVGTTENVMLAAALSEGETVITNAAREPEIVDLQNFLCSMGAKIKGAGTDRVVIEGVKELHDTEYSVIPDRIVAGTYLTAVAMTRGEIRLTSIVNEHIYPIVAKLVKTGCSVREERDAVYLKAPKIIRPLDTVRTLPHPGFPTDMQPQLMSYLCLADGTTVFTETVFESRNKHVSELKRMGAEVIVSQEGMIFFIKGVKKLYGSKVEAKDLRGGAALILAGLAAEGETLVSNSAHVLRGYECIERDLSLLGADIRHVV